MVKCFLKFHVQLQGVEVPRGAPAMAMEHLTRSLWKRMLRELRQPPNSLAVRGMLLEILSEFLLPMCRQLAGHRDDFDHFLPFFTYVREHLRRSFVLSDAARSMGMLGKTFEHAFKTRYGLSPKKFFLWEKLGELKSALAQNDPTIKEIISSYGFSDPYHFSRRFKKSSGYTPSEYRAHATAFSSSNSAPRGTPEYTSGNTT